MNAVGRVRKEITSESWAFKALAGMTLVLLTPYATAQGQGSWGGYLQSVLGVAVVIFWMLVLAFGYVIYLALYELVGTVIVQKFARIPIALILTISTLWTSKVLYVHNKETERQEAITKKELIAASEARSKQAADTELRRRYGIARDYLDKICPSSVSRVSSRIDGESGLKLGTGIRANGSADGWQSNEKRPDTTLAPEWTTSGVDVARTAVRSGMAFVETGYLRVGNLSWWEKHPEVRKRVQAAQAHSWPGTTDEEGIIGLEDIEPWAKYQLIVQNRTTPEDKRHWTSRILLALERIDSGERVAEYTSLHAYGMLKGRSLDELGLPVTCSLEEEKYKSIGEKNPPHWDPFGYFLKEVIDVANGTK